MAARPYGVRLSLTDYEADSLSPVRSADLLQAAATPESNPFYGWFRERLSEILAETDCLARRFFDQLSQSSADRLCDDRSSQAGVPVAPDRSRRRAHHLLDACPRLAESLCRASWTTMICGPGEAALLALLGEKYDGGPDRPDLDGFSPGGLPGPRCDSSLQRLQRLLVGPLFLLPGAGRGKSLPPAPARACHGGTPRPDDTE